MDNAPNQRTARRSMWATPQGRARLLGIQERFADTLRDPETTPWERTRAWSQYRTERFTETGLEGMRGSSAVYHLITDFGGALVGMAQVLASPVSRRNKEAATRVVQLATHAVGYRWCRGVDGLRIALEECGAPSEQRTVFLAERQAFEQRFASLIDAVGALLNERLPAPAKAAARGCAEVLMGEAESLANWLEDAHLVSDANALRWHVQEARVIFQGE